jgi:predicted dehydrogenase
MRLVVVEKPACPTSAEVDKLIKLAKSKSLLFTVYQSLSPELHFGHIEDTNCFSDRRWDTDFLTVRKILSQKKLGKIVEFETHYDRYVPEPPKKGAWQVKDTPGSGIVYDLGTHLIDQIVVLFGMPEEVTGFVRRLTQSTVDDAFTILLHYKDMLATVKATVLSVDSKQLRYWIRGDQGSYTKVRLFKA